MRGGSALHLRKTTRAEALLYVRPQRLRTLEVEENTRAVRWDKD